MMSLEDYLVCFPKLGCFCLDSGDGNVLSITINQGKVKVNQVGRVNHKLSFYKPLFTMINKDQDVSMCACARFTLFVQLLITGKNQNAKKVRPQCVVANETLQKQNLEIGESANLSYKEN